MITECMFAFKRIDSGIVPIAIFADCSTYVYPQESMAKKERKCHRARIYKSLVYDIAIMPSCHHLLCRAPAKESRMYGEKWLWLAKCQKLSLLGELAWTAEAEPSIFYPPETFTTDGEKKGQKTGHVRT